jgi:hypothetical protein
MNGSGHTGRVGAKQRTDISIAHLKLRSDGTRVNPSRWATWGCGRFAQTSSSTAVNVHAPQVPCVSQRAVHDSGTAASGPSKVGADPPFAAQSDAPVTPQQHQNSREHKVCDGAHHQCKHHAPQYAAFAPCAKPPAATRNLHAQPCQKWTGRPLFLVSKLHLRWSVECNAKGVRAHECGPPLISSSIRSRPATLASPCPHAL